MGLYDAVIVGGGPAGLNAALILGRCKRRVLVCDSGKPRNAASHALHGFLSRDGIPPAELTRIGREQLCPYSIEFRCLSVTSAWREDGRFLIELEDGELVEARKLLLATGVADVLPPIEGIRQFYGRSVFHCPYCDGWEMRDQPLAVYGRGKHGFTLALSLKTWTDDVVLCTDGSSRLRAAQFKILERACIPVYPARISRLEGGDGRLERIVFNNGDFIARRGLFFNTGQNQRSLLPAQFGPLFNGKGTVVTNRFQATEVPGLYVAGDAARDVQFAIVAAAEGAKAGIAINMALQEEERAQLVQCNEELGQLSSEEAAELSGDLDRVPETS